MPDADEHRTLADLLFRREPRRKVHPRLARVFVGPDVLQICHAHRFDLLRDDFHNFRCDMVGIEGC